MKILITGDTYLGGGRLKHVIEDIDIHNLFGDFLNRIQEADLSITNLESPIIDEGKPIFKTGPNLKSPIQSLKIIKKGGFDLLTLANNHIMDYGKEGLISTLERCTRLGLNTVGAGTNPRQAERPFFIERNGIKVSVLNFAENEFGVLSNNSVGANGLNPVRNYYQIKKAKKISDYVIVIVHGGHERYALPSPRMKETYRFFVDAGADTVVGHHPHCFSGYDIYKSKPIFYSIGNFLFDLPSENNTDWNEGYILEFSIRKSKVDFEIVPYKQNNEKIGLSNLKKKDLNLFFEKIATLNNTIADDKKLKDKFEEFCESSSKQYRNYIEPYSNRYLHKLRNLNLFPSLVSLRKKRLLLNLTRCEAHRDILQKILEQ